MCFVDITPRSDYLDLFAHNYDMIINVNVLLYSFIHISFALHLYKISDDAIWLVPYTAPQLPTCTRIIHGILFVATLEVLASLCVVIASTLQWIVWEDEEIVLGAIGAGICWVIALVLYIRKWLKRRRRANAQSELERRTTQQTTNTEYGSTDHHPEEENIIDRPSDEDDIDDKVSSAPSPCTVISFTTLGALDEVSLDLCLGTFFAACIILFIVVFFLHQCQPLLDWLDRIPLYGIVTMFALVLSVSVIYDVISLDYNEEDVEV